MNSCHDQDLNKLNARVTMIFKHEQKPGSLNHVVYQFILCMSEALHNMYFPI